MRTEKEVEVMRLFIDGAISGISERGTVAIVNKLRDILEEKGTFLYICNTPIVYREWGVFADKFFILDTPISKTIDKYKKLFKIMVKEYASTFGHTVTYSITNREIFKRFVESQDLYAGKL